MSPRRADVLVVGGGIAGVSTAALIAEHASVLLIEAESELSRHSTGRSAAAYLPSYGSAAVRVLTAASRAPYHAMSDAVGIALLTPRPVLWLATDAAGAATVARLAATASTVRAISADDALGFCPALRAELIRAALVDADAADIDVAALHQAYVGLLRRRGGTILRGAQLRSAARSAGGWIIECADGPIEAGVIVDAAGAWADDVAARCGVRQLGLQPMRRTAAITPVAARFAPSGQWPLVCEATDQWYFRPEGPDRLMVSLSEETPMPPCDVRPDDTDVALAVERINAATMLDIRRVEHSWAGLRSFVPDRQPVAGAWSDHDGFVFAAGQGGYGIQLGPALAALVAALVVGAPLPTELAAVRAAVAPDRLRASPVPDSAQS